VGCCGACTLGRSTAAAVGAGHGGVSDSEAWTWLCGCPYALVLATLAQMPRKGSHTAERRAACGARRGGAMPA
jgi:hypothetical protein